MRIETLIGPRKPIVQEDTPVVRFRYWLPVILFSLAALCLISTIVLPYWKLTLLAPQYPGGLEVQAYVNHLSGDIREIDGLNHYIGMRPLGEAAQLEKSLSIIGIISLGLLVVAAIFIHSKFAAILALPVILYPFIFLGDMYFWLRYFGLHLDPKAPLSSAIKPFVPPVLGEGVVGQFKTISMVQSGFYLALAATILVLLGLYFQRRAYKPLVVN